MSKCEDKKENMEVMKGKMEIMLIWIEWVEREILSELKSGHNWQKFRDEYPTWFDQDGNLK